MYIVSGFHGHLLFLRIGVEVGIKIEVDCSRIRLDFGKSVI